MAQSRCQRNQTTHLILNMKNTSSAPACFQTITPQGWALEEGLFDEVDARQLAEAGETLVNVAFARKHGEDVLTTIARAEKVGKGFLLYPLYEMPIKRNA